MSAPVAARNARRTGPLTDKGLTAVSLFKLRECWEDIGPRERRQLTAELALLVLRFAPRRVVGR